MNFYTLDDELLNLLGKRIKELRTSQGMSLSKLSELSSIEKSSLSRIENGKINITYFTLWRLSHSLKIPLKDMCENIDQQNCKNKSIP